MSHNRKTKAIKVSMNSSHTSPSLWNISSETWLSNKDIFNLSAETLRKLRSLSASDLKVDAEEVDEALGKNSLTKSEEFRLKVS